MEFASLETAGLVPDIACNHTYYIYLKAHYYSIPLILGQGYNSEHFFFGVYFYASAIAPRILVRSNPLGTRHCCDVESTSLPLIQRHNNVVCPVG